MFAARSVGALCAIRPVFMALLLGSTVMGCATYTQDLERARRHYQGNQYENALALFRVLERDMDSLSPAERVQFAYLRGMTDYRLASTAAGGTGVKNPKQSFRHHARHWLGLSAAMEQDVPGSLNGDEKERLAKALDDLNHEVFGGAEREEEQDEVGQGQNDSWSSGEQPGEGAPGETPADAPTDAPPEPDPSVAPDNGI